MTPCRWGAYFHPHSNRINGREHRCEEAPWFDDFCKIPLAPEPIAVLSIDAWRDCGGGWSWNAWYRTSVTLPAGVANLSPRRFLRLLRTEGLLSARSAGKVALDDDGYNLTVINRHTREPLFALAYGDALS